MNKDDQRILDLPRSSENAFEIWRTIKPDILRFAGILENPFFYFYIDKYELYKNVSDEKLDFKFTENTTSNLNTELHKNTSISYEINLEFNQNTNIFFNNAIYYHINDDEIFDDGTIAYNYTNKVSLKDIKTFRKDFILEIGRESRIAWQKTINEVKIESRKNKSFLIKDSIVEQLEICAKLEKTTIQEAFEYHKDYLIESKHQEGIRRLIKNIDYV